MADRKATQFFYSELGEQVKVEFEPTASYIHEVHKFKTAHASVRDKVQSFNEATQFWDSAKYLKNVHRAERPSDKERQGRKLNLSQYYERMKKAHLKSSPVRSKRAKVIPDYVIPSEQPRSDVRYNIRMKMARSSGIRFKTSSKGSRKKSPHARLDVTGNITN